MFTDYLGATFNLSQLAHAESLYELRFLDDEAAELDVANVTFTGWVTNAAGSKYELSARHELSGRVAVRFPDLDVGAYKWEVQATDDSGNSSRIVSGRLQVLGTILQLTSDAYYAERTLNVRIPSAEGEHLLLQWNASTAAEFAVQKCAEYLDAAKKAAEEAIKVVDGATDAVNAAIKEMEAVKKAAEDATLAAAIALGKLDNLDALLEEFRHALASQISIDPVTNYWIIAGVNSFTKATGEPGKSPKLSTAFTWLVYNDDTQQWEDKGVSAVGQDGKSPYISSLGTWVEYRDGAWVDTGTYAAGKDGIDGSAVHRILVQQVEDIPTSGETCTGGFFYYVPIPDVLPSAVITPQAEGRAETDTLAIDGISVSLEGLATLEPAACAAALLQAIVNANIPGVTGTVEGNQVHLETANVTLTVDEPGDGYHVQETPFLPGGGYRVYAWLEHKDGSSGWVLVGINNDIATPELYGLVKTATYLTIQNGAPVGNNRSGQLSVPLAEYLLAGAVKRATAEFLSLENGGAVTTDTDGHMVAQPANSQRWGVMKHSTGLQAEVPCIGLLPDGSTGCTWADLNHGGVVKPGSEMRQLNDIPYQQAVGIDDEHCLCNNFLNEGALKHMRPAGWVQCMEWVQKLPVDTFDADSYYTGLHTSPQFGQDRENGLTLNSATATLKAGVYLAGGRDDTRAQAVLTASQTATFYYNKDEVYSKTETYSRSETYSRTEVYAKDETYRKDEVYSKDEVEAKIKAAIGEVEKKFDVIGTDMSPVPTGSMIFSMKSSMSGFLLCNGAAVSRTAYAALFAVIGTKFGNGDGATTFNLPNMKGRVMQGANDNLGSTIAAGLPNVKGHIFGAYYGYGYWTFNGAFSEHARDGYETRGGGGGNQRCISIAFDASASNPIYGSSSTVQPPAIALNAFIKC